MRIAIAQVNPTVGDLAGNRRLVEEAAAKAASERADVVVLPELVLTGYPPLDLLERDGFVRDQLRELERSRRPRARRDPARRRAAARTARGPRSSRTPRCCWPAGAARGPQAKTLLPTYDVFDEKRYFVPAARREPVSLGSAARRSG